MLIERFELFGPPSSTQLSSRKHGHHDDQAPGRSLNLALPAVFPCIRSPRAFAGSLRHEKALHAGGKVWAPLFHFNSESFTLRFSFAERSAAKTTRWLSKAVSKSVS